MRRSFTDDRRIRPVENRTILDMIIYGRSDRGGRRLAAVVKRVVKPTCLTTGQGPFLLQPSSSRDGRVRVKFRYARVGGRRGYPVCDAGWLARAGLRVGLDGGGLPVTPAGLWDLSPFYTSLLPAESQAADQHMCTVRRVPGPPTSARPGAKGKLIRATDRNVPGHGRRSRSGYADRPPSPLQRDDR